MITQSVEKGTPLYSAINNILKGKEIKMPEGLDFKDKDGTSRTEIRIKWWEDPTKSNYKRISIEPIHNLPEIPVAINDLKNTDFYTEKDKPVFFGHYWLKGNPSLYRGNICCLDYSVARDGYLCAYRFDGEDILETRKLIYV